MVARYNPINNRMLIACVIKEQTDTQKVKGRPTMRAGGLGGTRREKTAVSAKAFFRFVGWSPHQAANASRWAPSRKEI